MNIGVIGLGIIGSRMAANWQKAGHTVRGWNRTRANAGNLGIPLCATPAELASASELIMVVVADPPALDAVLAGPGGVCSTPLAGRIVLNSSTVGADDNIRAAKAVTAAGGRFLETPFTGSKGAAEAGKIVFYAGGEKDLLREVEPVLLQTGSKIFHFGGVGAAADTKLIMNLMLANAMQAMAEGYAFAEKAGLDMKTFVEAHKLNAGWSGLCDMKAPKLLTRDFSPHFALKHMNKDIRLALKRSDALGLKLKQAANLVDIYALAMQQGLGEDDISVLAKAIETRPQP